MEGRHKVALKKLRSPSPETTSQYTIRMPLTPEFRHHLRELMAETSERLRDDLNDQKRRAVWEARQTHNAAAVPIAYSKASIHAFRTRASETIAKYLRALEDFGIEVNQGIEIEMLAIIGQLTNASPSLSLPPGARTANVAAIRRAHKMEASRIGSSLYREAANRLREMKARSNRSRIERSAARPVAGSPTQQKTPNAPRREAGGGGREEEQAPTAFVSYSWETEEHKDWVLHLATRLRSQGVNVVLDRWHLKVGEDRTHFMEDRISSSEFVIIICTPTYAQKANKRDGGVGYEAMIITGKVATNILQDKFIPILRSGGFDDSAVPIWLQSKIGVDLRGNPYDERQYQLLLEALHRSQPAAPPLGPKPTFPSTIPQTEGLAPNAVSTILGRDSAAGDSLQTAPRTSGRHQRSPIAYAWYESKGPNAGRTQVYIRPADHDGELLFETSTGEYHEGTPSEVEQKYLVFDLQLRQKGYVRMQTFNGSGGQSFNLP